MQHGGDGFVEDIVVPDALPVIAQHQTIAQANRHLAGVGHLHLAQFSEENGRQNFDMPGQEGNRRLARDAPPLGFIDGFRHGVKRRGAENFHQGRFEEGDIADAHDKAVGHRRKHLFADRPGLGKIRVIALDFRHDDILLAGDATEIILACFGRFLLDEEGGMAGMGDDKGAIVAERQLLRHCRRRIKNDQCRTRRHHLHDIDGNRLDDHIGNREYNNLALRHNGFGRYRRKTPRTNRGHPGFRSFAKMQRDSIGMLGQIIGHARPHFAASADHANNDFLFHFIPQKSLQTLNV